MRKYAPQQIYRCGYSVLCAWGVPLLILAIVLSPLQFAYLACECADCCCGVADTCCCADSDSACCDYAEPCCCCCAADASQLKGCSCQRSGESGPSCGSLCCCCEVGLAAEPHLVAAIGDGGESLAYDQVLTLGVLQVPNQAGLKCFDVSLFFPTNLRVMNCRWQI